MSSDSDYTCMIRHHTHKRKKIVISDSDSSDESLVIQTRRKKKILRVVSEGESSSDDSDLPKPVIRRQNHRVISEDESNYNSSPGGSRCIEDDSSTTSEWESDWSSSNESEEDTKKYKTKRKVLSKTKSIDKPCSSSSTNANINSESSDDQSSEKCPICLLPFRKQQVGTPSVCDHCFCLECLLEWSKNINTCPVDRSPFTSIIVREHFDGKIIKELPVEIVPRIENQMLDDPTFCEICHQSDREDRMLLCDDCDRGYHMECLTPPMTTVPIEEWYCPGCSDNARTFVSNFIPTLITPRNSGRFLREIRRNLSIFRNILPQANDRAYVPVSRAQTAHHRDPADVAVPLIDPNQPSTSSGLDSIGDNSRSRSPNTSLEGTASSTRSNTKSKTKTMKRKKKKLTKSSKKISDLVREVRIKEYNNDGEEEEIVTYVKVASSTSRRKCKKRTKKTRKRRKYKCRARTASMLTNTRTVKRRLASTLGMKKPKVPLLLPTMKSNSSIPEKSILTNARYSAGIPQVSLFGNNLGLDYSPPGSDDDDEYSIGIGQGPIINVRQRRLAVPSIRRRTALKGIVNPVSEMNNAGITDLLDSIMSSQELWHSIKKKDDVILKGDGTLIVNNSEKENKHSINNNESPKKEKQDEEEVTRREEAILEEVDTPLDLSNINANDITQAPMYNNPCGGGGGGGGSGGGNRGNFRGGYGRDNSRHGHGGQTYGGGRDSMPPGGGGRHNYSGGTGGGGPRDNFGNRDFGPPPFFNPNFEHCGGPPMFGAHVPPPPFRSRNPQHFRNERLRFPPPPPPAERPFNFTDGSGGFERPPFPHVTDRFPRPRPPPLGMPPGPSIPPPNMHNSLPPVSLPEDMTGNYQPPPEQNDRIVIPDPVAVTVSPIVASPAAASPATRQDNDDCDIYCDIEPPSKPDCEAQEELHSNGSMILLPPPEPPSGLLDFEENSRSDKDDSEQELVIDDSHKEDTSRELPTSGDKYDPFAADSDSNDDATTPLTLQKATSETAEVSRNSCNIPMPIAPPLVSTTYPSIPTTAAIQSRERPQEPIRLTAYDDDDDNDSQSDCPNFSIYSSQTMDVARHTEQELSQQLGPLQPPPIPPNIPDDDDIIVGDVQACDFPDVPPEPANPYLEALQKERQTLSKIPPKKISHDSHRGKITFKIGNKLRLNNRLSGLHSEDHSQNTSFLQKKTPTVQSIDKLQVERDSDKNVSSSKSAMESTVVKPSIVSNQLIKIGPGFAEEEEEVEEEKSTELAISSSKKKEPLKPASRHESKELHSESSSDEETTKIDEKTKDIDASSNKKEEEDSEWEMLDTPSENVAVAESAESSALDTAERLSPRKLDGSELSIECSSEDLEGGDTTSKIALSHSKTESRDETSARDDSRDRESSSDDDERLPSSCKLAEADRDDKASSDNEDPNSSDQRHEKASFSTVDDEAEQFPIEKDKLDELPAPAITIDNNWESDGAYTPCKDELPIRDEMQVERYTTSFEIGLEPITPTKDKTNDDLDDCRSPTGYAELGTEAISETDEAINFEEELNALMLRKEKEMEDGEILDESKLDIKEREKLKEDKEDDNKKKRKKDKKEKSKESTEKNKENISSDNLVSWKKLSKSTRDRPYRDKDKRSKSREREKEKEKEKDKDKSFKKKTKEIGKKKEKRKELPRYDVRKIVAEKPSRPRKDEYGRDIREKSRSRSRSRSSNRMQSGSKDQRSRSYSKGRSKSRSRLRLSWSRDRGPSYSKSCSSNSRRRSSSRIRRKSRRRSLSRRHSISRRRSRSLSRKRRSLSPRRRGRRSLSRSRDKRKEKAKKYKSRSRSRNRKRSRSKSPKRTTSKTRDKKHSKRKAHSRSRSKGRSISRERDRNRNWDQLNEKSVEQEQQFPREREERSWSAQWTPSWSRSRSKTPPHIQEERISSRNWSPPPVLDSVSPKNLTVILTNKEAIKKKKKERRKESRKSKEAEKRRKSKRNRTPPPSKEVFASGDNILVSVCFNKDNEMNPSATPELPPTIPLSPPIKRRRRESVQIEPTPSAKRSKKEKTKDKRSKSPKVKKDKKKKSKAAEIAATKKPVAVIDLDQSPFREQTPSPRDVIILSDDDDKQAQETLAASPEQCPPSQASPPREQFVSQGPKTPPEPQIKFSINKQPSNLRPSLINPLLEEEEEEEEEMMDERAEEELEMRAQEELELRLKIGPNTPPEPPTSPPTSPDAYDPFDPTKSRSPTPDASQEATPNDERDRGQRNSPRKHEGPVDTPLPLDEPSQQQEQPSQEKPIEKPKIISMVTIKRPSPQRDVSASPVPENQADIVQSCSSSPPKTQQNPQNVQSTANPFSTINPVLATVAAAVQRSFNPSTTMPNTTQRTLLQPNRISPSNQIKQRTNDRPQLPNVFANSAKSAAMARSSKSTQNKNSSTVGQNGSDATIDMTNDNVIDMSSPYSPGSTLSDGLFDPPSPANFNNSPVANAPPAAAKTSTPKINKSTEKKDPFDALFGSILPSVKTATKNRSKKVAKEKTKKSTNPKVGVRMDENQLQILDDLPSSAVEMQVKDKFLKKLNRQERVVEEVKLVLKPHYTKKHITKEEYKDIMRKAVPKICHNKTGEINPKKIAHLIEAYVRKCRNNKKKTSAKITKPAKTLWS